MNKPPLTPPPELTQLRAQVRSRAMAQAVVSAFAASLKDEARKKGGFLTVKDLDDMDSRFQKKAEQLSQVFEQSFIDAAREQEELKWHSLKRPAFDRMMVKRFADMFMVHDADGHVHGSITRRMLPGFFLGLSMMLGPDALKDLQDRCEAAMNRVMKGMVPVDWDLLDQDREVQDVMLDAELAISQHFQNPKRRADWFIQLINANLAPAHEKASEAEKNFEMDHRTFHKMIVLLLSDLRQAVGDSQEWKRLKKRNPDADINELAQILDALN